MIPISHHVSALSPATLEAAIDRSEYVISYDEITRCLLLGLDDLRQKLELARETQRAAQSAKPARAPEPIVRTPPPRRREPAPCWFYASDALLA